MRRSSKRSAEGNLLFAEGLLPPGLPGYSESLRGIPYDPEEAKRLFAESKYADNFPRVVYTTSGADTVPDDVQMLVDAWQEVLGVEVEVELIPSDAYFYQLAELGR